MQRWFSKLGELYCCIEDLCKRNDDVSICSEVQSKNLCLIGLRLVVQQNTESDLEKLMANLHFLV